MRVAAISVCFQSIRRRRAEAPTTLHFHVFGNNPVPFHPPNPPSPTSDQDLPVLDKVIDRRNSGSVMGLGEHLEELRTRLLWAVVPLIPVMAVTMIFGKELLKFMLAPVLKALREAGANPHIQTTTALEAFTSYFYVAFIAAAVIGGPWIIYQFWKFVAPGLYSNEKRFAYLLAPMSAILSVAGACMMYFGMLPLALAFLINFGSDIANEAVPTAPLPAGFTLPSIPMLEADPDKPMPGQYWINKPLEEVRMCLVVDDKGVPDIRRIAHLSRDTAIETHLKLDTYVDLFLMLLMVFVVAFQLPVVILLLGWAGIVNVKQLSKWRKFAFAGSIIIGAVVSPTGDPISLAMLQVPLYILYELGILLLRFLPASRVAGTKPKPPEGDAATEGHDAGGP